MIDRDLTISRYLIDDLNDRETRELSEWIKADPRNAEWFALEVFIHSQLRGCLRGETICRQWTEVAADTARKQRRLDRRERKGTPSARPVAQQTKSLFKIPRLYLVFGAMAASLALVVIVARWLPNGQGAAVATVASTIDAQWRGSEGLKAGQGLLPGSYNLAAGLCQLKFPDGAEAIVEGPSSFVLSANRLRLDTGKAVVTCPSAKSRSLVTEVSGAKVEDLGTEYGLASFSSGYSKVIVFQGAVRLTAAPESVNPVIQVLGAGEGRTIDRHLEIPEPIGNAPIWFVRSGEFSARSLAAVNSDAGHYWASALPMLKDPDLLCWLDMRPSADGTSTENLVGQGPWIHTADVGTPANFVSGRLDDERAIEFVHPTQALRINIPGRFQNLTLAAWVRLNPEDEHSSRHRGLLMSDRWGSAQQVHWQMKGAALHLSFFSRDEEDSRFGASFDGLRDNAWHLLVSEIQTSKGSATISHYVDGDIVYRRSVPIKNPYFTFGKCSVGGWAAGPGKKDDDRTLDGCMNDLMVWGRALASGEIKNLYQFGGESPAQTIH